MEKYEENFCSGDEVATVSPKSGLVEYGYAVMKSKSRSEIEFETNTYKNVDVFTVKWHPNGDQKMISVDKLVLRDRHFKPDDVVVKVSDPCQFGYCENIDINTTVKILNTNKVIENINYRDLTSTKPIALHSPVYYESWVGRVNNIKFNVTFTSQDGTIFILHNPSILDFKRLSKNIGFSIDDTEFLVGQKLEMYLGSLVNAKLLNLTNYMRCLWDKYKKKLSYTYGLKWIVVYVKEVVPSKVDIQWYYNTASRTGQQEYSRPERVLTGDNLKKLKGFDVLNPYSIQLGNINWYTIKDTDNLMTLQQWKSKCTENFNTVHGSLNFKTDKVHFKTDHNKLLHGKKSSKNSKSKNFALKSNRLNRNRMWISLINKNKKNNKLKISTKPNSKVAVEICYTTSVVDVIWQDGTRETGISSTDLYKAPILDGLEFLPGQFVAEKNPVSNVYGLIESVDRRECIAHIQWFKVNHTNPSLPNLIEKNYFSIYDIHIHPDFLFDFGCIVIHINPDTNPDVNSLTVGQVLSSVADGKIIVMWVNGEKTECWPQELLIVKLNDYGYHFQDEKYDGCCDLFEQSFQKKRMRFDLSSFLQTYKFTETNPVFKDHMDNIPKIDENKLEEEDPSYDIIKDKATRLNLHMSQSFNVTGSIGLTKTLTKNDVETMDMTEPTSVHPLVEQDSTGGCLITMDTETENVFEVMTKSEEAGVFGVIHTLIDDSHKYINENNDFQLLEKVISKDIQILKNSLPAGIWVKTFENRLDLFSIMIRGPEKTPYAGGLFLFDVKIPSTYPNQPPLCYHYSYCDDQLSPNLHEDGYVCLSLLSTCNEQGVELWSPNNSNLLQLLVTIQRLILVSEPCYNEPGFDSYRGQKFGIETSRLYNEKVLIRVVQSMTTMLKLNSDIKNGYFKEEILEHVTTHGPKLINTIENWIKISEKKLTEDEKLVPGYPLLPLSKGFCLSIIKTLKDYKEVLISMNINMFKKSEVTLIT